MKKTNSTTDKKTMKIRIKTLSTMISQAYQFPYIKHLTYSQYRLAGCLSKTNNLKIKSLKKVRTDLIQCQSQYPNGWEDSLGGCILTAVVK